ncbi:MAG: carbohydrate ABC transporter permease [Ignavibacteriaceae bacterium]
MKEERIKKLLFFFSAAFLMLFCIIPILWMIVVSFSKNPDFLSEQVSYFFTLNNYSEIFTSNAVHLIAYLKNSIIISGLAAFFTTIIASLSAYSITRLKFPGKIIIPVFLLGVSMFPQISLIGYLFKILTNLNWINTYYALLFPYITLSLPLALWILLSHFSRLSKELDNAALIDGAGRFKILQKIILPVSLPGLFSAFILSFIFTFNEFLFALMFTIDYKARTIPVGIALFEGLHGQIPWGYIMAASVIAVIPIIIIIALFQKYIMQGLTEGAIKG